MTHSTPISAAYIVGSHKRVELPPTGGVSVLGSKLKVLAELLGSSELTDDRDLSDIVDILQSSKECSSVRYNVEHRDNGQTHFLRVGIGDALLCVDFFNTDKYFAVRRGTVVRDNVAVGFRWHHTLDGFEYEGAEADRAGVYQFLSEVVKGF